jgi:hypothetical protein
MNQLGDLEKILSAAKEIGENFQKELSNLREEKELLEIEMKELREENKILREENEKIYVEMNNLRNAKEEIRTANETFSNNMNQLVTQLEDNHKKTMTHINELLTEGLQNFVVEYMKKFNYVENVPESTNTETEISDEQIFEETTDDIKISDEITEVGTLDKYSSDEIIVEDVKTAVVPNNGSKKNKMQYAAFYAEEVGVERDDATNKSKNRSYR